MKTIGLIGGISWVSTSVYYKLINEKINKKLKGHHSAKLILHSVDFQEILDFLHVKDWRGVEDVILEEVRNLKKSGADFFAISSNTMAPVGQKVEKRSQLKIVDITEVTALELQKNTIKKTGLLGTGFTMRGSFFSKALNAKNIEVTSVSQREMEKINHIITDEPTKGIINPESKQYLLDVIHRLATEEQVEGIILGCTELPLILGSADTNVRLFDTTEIHTDSLVDYALSE